MILCAASPADLSAAIAPYYERVRQFSFVMSAANEAATKLASHGLIDRIERLEDGTFRLLGQAVLRGGDAQGSPGG